MIIDTTLEKPDGTLHFSGELTGKELTAVINYGLNTIFLLGLIPAKNITEHDEDDGEGETMQ